MATEPSQVRTGMPRLIVHPSRRFLATEDGSPFFWLADTAWWIQSIPPQQSEDYMTHRAAQGFNLIQVHSSYDRADYAGNRSFERDDPSRPADLFWQGMDRIISQAQAHGLYVALAPMWGNEYKKAFRGDASAAEEFGRWIGNRYSNQSHVLWIVSGEYDAINDYSLPISADQKRLFNAVAAGLRSAHHGRQLMTIHPGAARTSALDFHDEDWLDFNMLQSGHMNDCAAYGLPENHELIAACYARTPVKPVLDGEPIYEDTPDGVWVSKSIHRARADAAAMRRKAYGAVFAGACGHTYGHNDVYGFFTPAYPGHFMDLPEGPGNRGDWRVSIRASGALQMKHIRALMESRSFFDRIPDDTLVVSSLGTGLARIRATRNIEGSWAMVYLPFGQPVQLDRSRLAGKQFQVSWFDPRLGSITVSPPAPISAGQVFTSPFIGDDWVLIVDAV